MTMDYEKTRQDLISRRREISERQKAIIGERASLDKEYQELQQELVSVDHMLEGLSFLQPGSTPPDFEDLGFGQKVEVIMKQTPIHLFPTQIRDELVDKGTKGSSPKNLLISIHNVLSRIEKSLDVKEIDGRSAYKWKESPPVQNRSADLAGVNRGGLLEALRRLEQSGQPAKKK
ncbi:hypothetical protein AYO50_01245 [Acidobacteria bacterium SCGC AG-212-P17]|nr:hypothetical protein AYO50_01245 [Acidobacteria bacterium SCGC AG-212-P17]